MVVVIQIGHSLEYPQLHGKFNVQHQLLFGKSKYQNVILLVSIIQPFTLKEVQMEEHPGQHSFIPMVP